MKLGLALITLLFQSWTQNAQNRVIDSIYDVSLHKKNTTEQVDYLNENAVLFKSKDFTTSQGLAQKALDIATKNNYIDGVALAYRNMGIVATNQGNFNQAEEYYNKALLNSKTPKIKGQVYGSIGRLKAETSDFTACIDYQFKALEQFENCKAFDLQYVTLYNIANTYLQLGEIEKYKEYKNKALAAKELSENKTPSTPEIKTTLAAHPNTEATEHTAKASAFYEKQITQTDTLTDPLTSCTNFLALGKTNIQKGRFAEAKQQLEKALQLAKKLNNQVLQADIQKHFGDYYLALGNKNNTPQAFTKAVSYYKTALPIFTDNKQFLNATESATHLAELYHKLGDDKQAYLYQKKAQEYDDQMFTNSTKASAQNSENEYTIKIKNQRLQIQQLEIKSKEKQRWILLLIVGCLCSLGGMLVYQNRLSKKRNAQLQALNIELDQANKIKTRFFSIINHDLRGPVSKIISYLQLQKMQPSFMDEKTNEKLQEQTIDGAKNLLSSMEDLLLWSKGQMENFKPVPQLIDVEELFADIRKVFSGYTSVTFEFHNPDQLFLETDIDYLKTITRNLTSNAINVFTTTQNPTIVWKAYRENDQLYLSITDNGPGATLDQFKALYDDKEVIGIQSGLGLHLIRDLAKAIDCEITVDSKINEGTTITLKL